MVRVSEVPTLKNPWLVISMVTGVFPSNEHDVTGERILLTFRSGTSYATYTLSWVAHPFSPVTRTL